MLSTVPEAASAREPVQVRSTTTGFGVGSGTGSDHSMAVV
jgi:hypothetical protein